MTRSKWLFVLGTYLFIGLGLYLGTMLKVDLSLTTLSSSSSSEYKNYQSYSKKFPAQSGGVVVALKSNDGFKTRSDFIQIEELCDRISIQPGCLSLSSLTNIELPQKTGFGIRKRRILKLKSDKSFEKSYSRLDDYPDVTPKFLSDDRKAIRLFFSVNENGVSQERLEDIVDNFGFDEVHITGQKYLENDISERISYDVFWLPFISSLILLLMFLIWFQDIRSILVIASILGLNIAAVSLLFWTTNTQVGILTATVPLLIIVLSFCDIVHVLHKYKKQDSRLQIGVRIRETTKPLRLSLWLTSLTTFIAFALFFLSGVDEIVDFAIVTCGGIVTAYLSARFVLPIFIVAYGIKSFHRKEAFVKLANFLTTLQKSARSVAWISVICIATLSFFVWNSFKIDNSFRHRLDAESSIGKAMNFTDEYFDGTRSIEVVISADNVLTDEVIGRVDKIEDYLLKKYGCRSTFSVNSVIKRLNRFNAHGVRSEYKLPRTLEDKFLEQLLDYKEDLGLGNAMTDNKKTLRIIGRLPDIGSAEASRRNEALGAFLEKVKTNETNVFMSGFSYVSDQSTNRVTKLILLGIALSLFIAGIISAIVFKSWRIALISIVPNLLPLLFALLLIDWLGMGLNTTSVMALSIILGLSLDDTIYFLGSNFNKDSKVIEALSIDKSIKENTFPVMVTSLLLAAGFFILALSEFQQNRNIGILVGGVLLIAVISDLLILPALLRTIAIKKEN